MKFLYGSLLYMLCCMAYTAKGEDIPQIAHFLSDYIQYPSITGNEREAALFLKNFAEDKGLHVQMLHSDSGSYNLVASLYPLENELPNIIFLNHIDVVKAGDENLWEYPPFSGTIADGHVWGRGAIDNKGMAAMQLFAMIDYLNNIKNHSLPFNVTLLSVSNEEQGGLYGSKRVVDEFFDLLNPEVVFGEGGMGIKGLISSRPEQTIYGISIAQKRGLWLTLRSNINSSGHGSVPPLNYSNLELVRAVKRISKAHQPVRFTEPVNLMFFEIGNLDGGFRGMILRNTRLFRHVLRPVLRRDLLLKALVTNTITITDISNPVTSTNQIPQWATATLDCRLVPGYDTETFLNELRETLRGLDVEIEIIKETSPSRYTRPNEYYRYMKEAITITDPESGVIPILFPANNDNNFFRAEGVPVYGILPAKLKLNELQSIHNINERISVDALVKGKQIYSRFLENLLQIRHIEEAMK